MGRLHRLMPQDRPPQVPTELCKNRGLSPASQRRAAIPAAAATACRSVAIFLLCCCCCAPVPVAAQKAKLKKADMYMERLEYRAAMEIYQDILSRKSLPQAQLRMAEACRKLHDYSQAEKYYAEAVALPGAAPTDLYYYGLMLQRNGKCEEAQAQYAAFLRLKPYDLRREHLQQPCAYLNELRVKYAGEIAVYPTGFNGPYADISPAFYRGGLVFGAVRPDQNPDKRKPFFDLYFVPDSVLVRGQDTLAYTPQPFAIAGSSSPGNAAIATFSQDQSEVFYTRNRPEQASGALLRLEIVHARQAEQGWGQLESLPFNSAAYSVAHPSLSPDGTRLFFSSDMPGGYGGKDLYVSYRDEQGWGPPVNLGPQINTEGDEMYPYYHSDGILYFASDGLLGLGGQDIYKVAELEEGIWAEAANLGAPINSPADDFGIIVAPDGQMGYFTSNRPGGQGADDVYVFRHLGIGAHLAFLDDSTGDPVEGLVLKSACMDANTVSGANGRAAISVPRLGCCLFNGRLDGYKAVNLELCGRDLKSGQIVRVMLKREAPVMPPPQESEVAPVRVSGRVLNGDTGQPLASVAVRIVGQDCRGEFGHVTDEQGRYHIEVKAGCCYRVSAVQKGFFAKTVDELICAAEAAAGDSLRALDVVLQPFEAAKAPAAAPPVAINEADFKRSQKVYDDAKGVAYLLNIYYDIGRASVRPDAIPELQKLLRLLQENEALILEISSHTDSQGPDKYNQNLSQRRANAIVAWLIAKGIDRRRLIAKGYGEEKLVNQCANGIPCSEEAHQLNRRTEFRVLGELVGR